MTLQRPKLRGTAEAFASRLLGTGVTRTNVLESLVIAGFVRGLSVRDVEASLTDALGPESTVSKSTVSRICEAIRDEFDTWKTRDLSGVELDYFFADGSYFKMHPGAPAEPVLAAWAIDPDRKARVPGSRTRFGRETDAWACFFPGLTAVAATAAARHQRRRPGPDRRRRGRLRPLAAPALSIHRARNILAKVPVHAQAEVKAEYWEIFDDVDAEPGRTAVVARTAGPKAFASKWRNRYPAAVDCLETTSRRHLPALPRRALERIRHSNFIERTFGETRRRVKVDRPAPRRTLLPVARVGRARPRVVAGAGSP